MDYTDTLGLISDSFIEFSGKAIIILGSFILLALGYAIFKFGWAKLSTILTAPMNLRDRSMRVGDFYLWKTPYKGYNRWRSSKWNAEHTM